MTREDAISDAIHYARHRNSDSLIESCINDIFNYHEAQLKDANEEIKRLKEQYHQCLDDYIKCAERKDNQ